MVTTNPNLYQKDREAFLDQWNDKYPLSSGIGISGRVVFQEDRAFLEKNGDRFAEIEGLETAIFRQTDSHGYQPHRVLSSGDWIECVGVLKNGFLDLKEVVLLSPNRLDTVGHTNVSKLYRDWRIFVKTVESFFEELGFDSLSTPTLVTCPGTEPFLDAFKTELKVGSRSQTFYLPTSPEIHLKKCLARGWERIFEIRPCFRNGEISPLHQPEFLMLEWYRAFASTAELKEDLRSLVETLAPSFMKRRWSNVSVADLFMEHLNCQLTPQTTMEDLIDVALKNQVEIPSALDFDDVFFYLFVEKIEPQLVNYDCLFLHSYPPTQAALARLTPDGWGDRFEFYIEGIEIANAFNELNNPRLQRLRSQEDMEKKQLHGREAVNLDEDFFLHLEAGMPPSSGIALGLDRLFMALNNLDNISAFRLFPFE